MTNSFWKAKYDAYLEGDYSLSTERALSNIASKLPKKNMLEEDRTNWYAGDEDDFRYVRTFVAEGGTVRVEYHWFNQKNQRPNKHKVSTIVVAHETHQGLQTLVNRVGLDKLFPTEVSEVD